MNPEEFQKHIIPGLDIFNLVDNKKIGLTLLAGHDGLKQKVYIPRLQKPGLILAGHLEHLNREKIQIFGLTEISFLKNLEEKELADLVDQMFNQKLICCITTKSLDPPPYFLEIADLKGVPILQTSEKTSSFMKKLTSYLEKKLAPQTNIHGVLMSIQGVGVLILGKSGIGKSECALDLVSKGHRLVADDLIYLHRIGQEVIVGYGPEMIKHHMEIRGLGIINVKDLFGVISVMDSAKVELIIELMEWDIPTDLDRLGLEEDQMTILDVELPKIIIPVSPGRNLSIILEVAARNYILKKSGFHAAKTLDMNLTRTLKTSSTEPGGDDKDTRENQ